MLDFRAFRTWFYAPTAIRNQAAGLRIPLLSDHPFKMLDVRAFRAWFYAATAIRNQAA